MSSTKSHVSSGEENGASAPVRADDNVASGVASGEGDTFGDPRIGWIVVLLMMTAVAFCVALFAIYLGVAYGVLSWSALSFPPPLIR